MTRTLSFLSCILLAACVSGNTIHRKDESVKQSDLTNLMVKEHAFLDCMYKDPYFPKFLVDKCRDILLELCLKIEREKPKNLQEFYVLTHASTVKINGLQEEFYANGSEIETGARECLGDDFDFVAEAYGFDAATEEIIAPRDW